MAKRPPNFGGMGNIMKQAEKMQKQMLKLQAELEEREVEASTGGGMVTARVNGKGDLISIKINPEAVDPEDVEMLEDLILSAVNEANRKSKEMADKEMGKITGGLSIPGLF
jgi:DNA-binding YbaB/EbfC family protein